MVVVALIDVNPLVEPRHSVTLCLLELVVDSSNEDLKRVIQSGIECHNYDGLKIPSTYHCIFSFNFKTSEQCADAYMYMYTPTICIGCSTFL